MNLSKGFLFGIGLAGILAAVAIYGLSRSRHDPSAAALSAEVPAPPDGKSSTPLPGPGNGLGEPLLPLGSLVGGELGEEWAKALERECTMPPDALVEHTLGPGLSSFMVERSPSVLAVAVLKGSKLVSFGITFPAASAEGAARKQALLKDFDLSQNKEFQMVDRDFNPFSNTAAFYSKRGAPAVGAVMFTREDRTTLMIYDSSIINGEKFLPSVPPLIGGKSLKEMREEMQKRGKP